MITATTRHASRPVPVLDIGGTHVTAALVDPTASRPVPSPVIRRPLRAHADADAVLEIGRAHV